MKIVLLGAGNVGFHLGKKLHETGEEVIQVFSRKRRKANRLGHLISVKSTTSLNRISLEADLIILAIHDDAIAAVAGKLAERGFENKLIVHTSGATPLTVFEDTGLKRYGIFYPLQTFSISKEPAFEKIPFCVDALQTDDIQVLKKLALRLSPNVHYLNDEQRAQAHVAAVFVNNFTNHLYHIADDLLKRKNIPLEILIPLIEETVDKIKTNDPAVMQTGPAARGDEQTIKRHLKLLKENPDYRKLYRMLTESIVKSQKNAP